MKSQSRPPSSRSTLRLRRLGRYAAAAAVLVLVLLVALYAAARVYLPNFVARKAEVEAQLSAAVQHPVSLGRIEPEWDGFNPGVRVWGATVHRKDGGTPSVHAEEVRVSIAPLPLLWGSIEIHRLVIVRPALALERLADGRVHVVGLEAAAQTSPSTGAGLGWLLTQRRLVVRDGEVRWSDARDPGGALVLSQINARIRNVGDRHRLTVGAKFPPALCGECELSADLTGVPGAGPWDGEVSLRAKGLTLPALPLALRERLPAQLRGRIDAELWSDWRGGRPYLVRGDVAVDGLKFPWGAERRDFAMRHFAGNVTWRRSSDGWRLEMSRLALGLTREPWSAGRLRLQHGAAESLLELQHVRLDDLTAFVTEHRSEHPLLERWAELRPSGVVNDLNVKMRGPLTAPSDYALNAELVDLGTVMHARWPGVSGLSGRISVSAEKGELDLDARNFSLHLPTVFRAPLAAARAGGSVRWRKTATSWRIDGSNLNVHGEDGKGAATLALDIPRDTSRSPVLQLRVDFRDGNGAHAARYYPVRRLPAHVLAWMESAFVEGRITSGYLLYDGPIREFPFEQGQGRFALRAHVRDGVYRYLPGWTPLTRVDADVAVDGVDAVITGRGHIGALRAHDVRVEVARAPGAANRSVHVTGQVDGPVAETVRVLRAVESKTAFWRAPLDALGRAAGAGALDIDLRVPLKSEDGPSFLATYRFQDAALTLPNGSGLEAASGIVRFSEAGLRASSARARLFGGPVAVTSTTDGGDLRLQAQGRVLLPDLLRDRGPIAARLTGAVGWSLAWQAGPNGPQLRVESDLREVRSSLPPPLAKRGAGGLERLVLTTASSSRDALVLALEDGAELSGKLAFERERNKWRLAKGRIDVGRPGGGMPERQGLELGIKVDALDVDQWLPLLGDGARGAAPAALLTGITAEIGQLGLLNRDWGRVFVNVVRRRDEWRTVLDGDAAAGEAAFVPAGADGPRVRLDLAHLRLPPRRDLQALKQKPVDPRGLPTVQLRARSFEYKQRQFGELAFDAVSDGQGWRVDRLQLSRPEARLSVNGTWRRGGERETSDFDIELTSDNMGATLDAWGADGQMSGGQVKVQASLSWPGSPTNPTLAGLDGKVEVAAEKGRFLKVDPGAARLFGLLDLRSIGRYLTLDFSSAFGRGYAFDAIHGTVAIERGNASTADLVVNGPSLNLGVAGRVGLAAEDYDLVLEASPHIGDTLTLTSWGLFGPQAAAAVFALRKLFRREIQESTRVTYLVKGSWDSPTVTKLAKTRATEGDPSPQPP